MQSRTLDKGYHVEGTKSKRDDEIQDTSTAMHKISWQMQKLQDDSEDSKVHQNNQDNHIYHGQQMVGNMLHLICEGYTKVSSLRTYCYTKCEHRISNQENTLSWSERKRWQ